MATAHDGHFELGKTIDSSRGRRWMTTLRKLPMMAPKTPVTMKRKGQGSEASGNSVDTNDKGRFIHEALYPDECSLPTIFFLLHLPEQEMFQKCVVGGKAGDA